MNSGRSLAINSANSETTNSTRNSQSDTKPRRLAFKLRQRRALSGENSKPCGGAVTPIGPAGSISGRRSSRSNALSGILIFSSASSLMSTSHLPRLEIDAGIDPGVGEVGNQVNDQANQGENVQVREHHRIIAVEHALEAQQAEPVERENRLDQQRTC